MLLTYKYLIAVFCVLIFSAAPFISGACQDKDMIAGEGTYKQPEKAVTPESVRVHHNNPDLVVDLGVGLWANPIPVDWDHDGDSDLLVSTTDKPSGGLYYFENPGNDVFNPGIRIAEGKRKMTASWPEGKLRICTPGIVYEDFMEQLYGKPVEIPFKQRFHSGRTNQWKYADYNGDGILDLIIGVSDWREYGWDDAYNADGLWTNGPLHGYVYHIINKGTNEDPVYGKAKKLIAGGKVLDVYGKPSPNLVDWDGDGDLDLICGEFLDRITFFENTGTRNAPLYKPGEFLKVDGNILHLELEMPEVVVYDWDNDEDPDIIVGKEDGRVVFIENMGLDDKGLPLLAKPVYFKQKAAFVKCGALSTPCSFDWDGDGDEDIISGNTAGFVEFIENLDGGNPPEWAAPVRLKTGDETFRIMAGANLSIQGPAEEKWGYTVPFVADWNMDGLPDIVLNSIVGKIIYLPNTGSRTQPVLSEAQAIQVEWQGIPPKPEWNWWDPEAEDLVVQWRTRPLVTDLNKDGLNDLVLIDHEGYLSFFERKMSDKGLVLLPGKRIFYTDTGKPLQLNPKKAGGSGRRKIELVDWDGDGDLDLLANSKNAELYRNIGTNGEFIFQHEGDLSTVLLGGHSTSPTTVDWNKDGFPDLLMGAEDGFFYYLPVISNLRCEYLVNPCGIDVKNPRLSWILPSDRKGQIQAAFQILVAGSEELLEKDMGDLWDSGKMESECSVHIPYRGRELKAREKVYWKVRIWDHNGNPSAWSRTASWEMGLEPADWEAKWMGVSGYEQLNTRGSYPAIYFSKSVELPSRIKKARAYISGLGYYELSINGSKVGDHVLSPNHTNYDRRQSPADFDQEEVRNMSTRVLYETWDITPFLKQGRNSLEVCLGNGWYNQNERKEHLPYSYDSPRFIAQIELTYEDGTRDCILSDESWEASLGAILHNGVYSGERYDARLEDQKTLLKTIPVRPPEGGLRAQMSPPDRVTRIIKPTGMTMPAEGIYRYDLGEMISGWARLQVSGPRGTEITMNFIEEAGSGYGQTDSYILKGEGQEIWEPRFTWHAFRTIDVQSPIPLGLENLTGIVVNTDVKTAGSFRCSNALFNTIQDNFQRTQQGNMHGGVPSDCPHRERRGYTGDGQIAAQAAICTFDMAAFYSKWMQDLADAQNPESGYVPNTVPYQGGGGGTAWGSAYVLIPWYMYLYYGDTRILKQHYAGMKLWINYLEGLCDDSGILREKMLGEWVPPAATEIPPSLVSTAYYYHNLRLMSGIASVLDRPDDSIRFRELAHETKAAFNREYYDESSHSYSIGRQGANVFALGFDLVPEHRIRDVFGSLVNHIENNTDEHFDTGMMGTPLALDVLSRYGRADLAYSMMNQHDYPSFGDAIDQGATTLWETWMGDASHSHPMFGSVCRWFYQTLAGICPDPGHPGFRNTIIKPQALRNLEFAEARYESMQGSILSHWEWDGNDLVLNIGIPANTTATVILPASAAGEEQSIYQVESGKHQFRVKDAKLRAQASRLSAPRIIPADTLLFLPDTALVMITGEDDKASVRYTLNGKEPDEHSPLYCRPIKINSNATIKARLFRTGFSSSSCSTGKLNFIDPQLNGLSYRYYEGAWEQIPDFDNLEPTRTGSIFEIGLDQVPFKQEKFGLVLQGDIDIPETGTYTFYVNSNDGSRLFIDGELVIDNDGPHGALEKEGRKELGKGKHNLKITYFQAGGGFHLEAFLAGPGMEKESIPPDMLYKAIH